MIRGLLLSVLLVIAGGMPALADAELLSCIDQAGGEEADFVSCATNYYEACWTEGKDVVDYPPQTACYQKAINSVQDVQAELYRKVNEEGVSPVRAAFLRRALAISDAECQLMDELRPGRNDETDIAQAYYGAYCLAYRYAFSYWKVVVKGETK